MIKQSKPALKKTLLAGLVLSAFGSPGFAQTTPATNELQEIVVTGSRIQAPSGFNTPTPVTFVGEETIQQRATVNVGELLNELPAFRQTQSPDQNARNQVGPGSGGQLTVDLRGLGSVRTLTLVDGRRHVGSNLTGTVDTAMIPTSLIKRVEVVTGGASAAYGSDAVAGVVNFILDDKLDGLRSSIQFGQSQESDNRERAASLGFGSRFADDRGHVILGFDYAKNKGVGGIYSRDWARGEDGLVTAPANRAAGVPARLFLSNVEFSTITPGGIINSTTPASTNSALVGKAFGPGGVPYSFPFGTLYGTLMQGSSANYGYTSNGSFNIRTPVERYSTLARVNFDLTDSTTAFVEADFGHRSSDIVSSFHQTANLVIPSTNPYLDASIRQAMAAASITSLNVGRIDPDWGGLATENKTDTARLVAGLRGELNDDWKWDFYVQSGHSKNENLSPNSSIDSAIARASYVVQGPNGPECGPIATNPNLTADSVVNGRLVLGTRSRIAAIDAARGTTCVPYNIFGPGSASPAAINYVTGRSFGVVHLRQNVFAANITGQPLKLWAGPLSFATGVEYRKDTLSQKGDPLSALIAFSALNPQDFSGRNTVKEGYLEFGIPLLKDLPLIKALDADVAGRITNYATSGSVRTWKTGFSYTPIDMLRLRATKSRDIRAPNLSELYQLQGEVNTVTQYSNPFNSTSQRLAFIPGGNTSLVPEVADTLTAGFVLQPGGGVRVSVDYYNIKVKDVIDTINIQDLLNFCYAESTGGVPNPNSFYCSALTFTSNNVATAAKQVPANLNALKTKGYDFELSYNVPINSVGIPGAFNVRALGTYVKLLETTTRSTNGLTTVNRAGAALGGGVPSRVWNVNLNYGLGAFSNSAQLRYTSPIRFDATLRDPSDPDFNAAATNSINRNHFPSSFYVSYSAQYEFKKFYGGTLQIFGVINNLMDRDPPALAIAGFTTVTGNPYDFVGRSFKLGARYSY